MGAENQDIIKSPIKFDKKTRLPLWSGIREFQLKYDISIAKIGKFFDALKDGKVLATKCNQCNRVYFPPQAHCPYCKSNNNEWIEVPEVGILETFTIIKIKPKTFSHYEDYVLAIGNFGDNLKILSWLKIEDKTKIKIGMKIRLKVCKRVPENYYIYEFVPEEE